MKMRTLKNWQLWLIVLVSSTVIGYGTVMLFRFLVDVIVNVIENLAN